MRTARSEADVTAGTRRSLEIVLLTGGEDPHYAMGLAKALVARGVSVELVGSDEFAATDAATAKGITFHNLRGDVSRGAGTIAKLKRLGSYYLKLVSHIYRSRPTTIHILWNNRLEHFDRTALTLWYRLLGKRVFLTAHNVNARARDGRDSAFNRMTLRAQYRLCSGIFVHTEAMRDELVSHYGVDPQRVIIVPYGINDQVPSSGLQRRQARVIVGIKETAKAMLFFGSIAPYKGLHLLAEAFLSMADANPDLVLVIAGRPKKGAESYWNDIRAMLEPAIDTGRVRADIRHVPDVEIESYFAAADVLILPYTSIFQSGVLFCGFAYGLPALAADVGAFREDVIAGSTGLIFRPGDPAALRRAIETYFTSDLYLHLDEERARIRASSAAKHSWHTVADLTCQAYTARASREAS